MRRDAIGEEEPVPAEPSASQPRVQAVRAAVGACGWRTLTAEMVVRRLLGAVDRLMILEVIGAQPDAGAGDQASVEPADPGDERIEPLVHLMASFRWRAITLSRLVQLLLDALAQWWLRRDEFERGLARLLDEHH